MNCCGQVKGVKASEMLYSLIETAKANGLEPQTDPVNDLTT